MSFYYQKKEMDILKENREMKYSYQSIESTENGGAEFHIVQGETSRNMFYYTNNSLLDSTDVANKGASSSSMDLEGLHKKLNPHDVNIKIDNAGGRDLSGQSRE